jgi:hypothetical protein
MNAYEKLQKVQKAKLIAKWEATGLFQELSDEQTERLTTLLENQARYIVTNEQCKSLQHILFPLVRRVFGTRDYFATELPAFLDDNGKPHSVKTYNLDVKIQKDELNPDLLVCFGPGAAINREAELCAQLSKLFEESLEKLFGSKMLGIYVPFVVMETKDSYRFAIRCVEI